MDSTAEEPLSQRIFSGPPIMISKSLPFFNTTPTHRPTSSLSLFLLQHQRRNRRMGRRVKQIVTANYSEDK